MEILQVVVGVLDDLQVRRIARNGIRHRGAAERVDVAIRMNAVRVRRLGGVGELIPVVVIQPDIGEFLEARIAGIENQEDR